MGNTPSKSKPTPASSTRTSHDSPRAPRRDLNSNKAPIPVSGQRSAAPPEPSLAQAQGTTNRPRAIPSRQVGVFANPSSPSSSSAGSARPIPVATQQWQQQQGERQQQPYASTDPVEVAMGEILPTTAAAYDAHDDVGLPEPSQPVAVPDASSPRSPYAESLDTSRHSVQDLSYLTRPPRLPLPIEEEIHTPGSPIIAPTDTEPTHTRDLEPLDGDASADGLPQRTGSALSTTTLDEEDAEELRVDKTRPTVPTRLEWKRGGGKVYVTGTIFQWNRKHRLQPVEGQPGVFAAVINILPGTHHVRFLVDGQMQTSPDLPTTVDFGNNLVNYIEVNPDDVLPPTGTEQERAEEAEKLKAPPEPQDTEAKVAPKGKDVPPIESFAHEIPSYLVDFDRPEDSPLYQSALGAIDKLPTPPSLPGFLGKPILNAATLIKDDNSVLNMPNHTVLNHLATSSIKNNTLAVSATTRYKNKYVTTIIYKPTSTDD